MNLDDTFYIPTAGRYSDPENDDDALPIVYGPVFGPMDSGLWPLPCINQTSYVYCYAAHKVVSVGDGNPVTIYRNGIEVAGHDYAFDEDDDYEGLGSIATITFTVGIGAATHYGPGLDDMTAGGDYSGDEYRDYKVFIQSTGTPDLIMWSNDGGVSFAEVGRPIMAGAMELEDGVSVTFGATTGHTLMDAWSFRVRPTPVGSEISAKGLGTIHPVSGDLLSNPIDVCWDFLKTWCDVVDVMFDDTAKQTAYIKCAQNGYAAGGVINEDCTPWDKLVEILSSFLGSIYVNGQGLIVFSIDDNSIQTDPEIIQRHEAYLTDAKLKLSNLVNSVPFEFAYDYVKGQFWGGGSGSLNQDDASISMFGYRRPEETFKFYWCRDILIVDTVLDKIVKKLANPIYQIEVKDVTMKRLAVDIGDWVVFSALDLYDAEGLQMANRMWKVTGVSPDFRAGTMTFRALETPYYLTEQHLADGSILADGSHKAGNCRLSVTY
jgi:hypothetical protein